MRMTTAKLRKALAQGAKIVNPAQPWNNAEVSYEPRSPRDPQPWVYNDYRFSAGELEIQWGPNGAPVKITDIQADFMRACIDHKSWENGGGWMWANRSTSLRLAWALEKKGLLICVSSKPFRERFAPSDLGYRLFEKAYPRPEQSSIDTVLVMLAEQSWEWKPGCGWHYHNEGMTQLALEALVSDGYAVRAGTGYGMVSAGYQRALELGFNPNLFDDEG